jgi:hypothetical protein
MRTQLLAFFAVVSVAGCSVDIDGLFDGASDGDGGSGGNATTSASSASGSGQGPSSTASTGQTSSSVGPSTTVTSSAESTSVTTGPDGIVACRGAGDCSVAGDAVCCWNIALSEGSCQPSAAACDGQAVTAIDCQRPDDCPGGQVCCARREFPSNQSPYEATECVGPDQCQDPDRVACDPNAPDCPGGFSCKMSNFLPPDFFICSPN